MKFALVIFVMILLSCQSQQVKQIKNKQEDLQSSDSSKIQKKDSEIVNNRQSFPFFDSVFKKYELSIDQIRKNTLLDSIYYSGMFSDVVFTGDTLLSSHNGFIGTILTYDDRKSCIYKFLLIFNRVTNKNVDYKIIYTDCDHDESADYTTLRYKLINDSIFETTETYIPAKSKIQKIERFKWKISNIGEIDSL